MSKWTLSLLLCSLLILSGCSENTAEKHYPRIEFEVNEYQVQLACVECRNIELNKKVDFHTLKFNLPNNPIYGYIGNHPDINTLYLDHQKVTEGNSTQRSQICLSYTENNLFSGECLVKMEESIRHPQFIHLYYSGVEHDYTSTILSIIRTVAVDMKYP